MCQWHYPMTTSLCGSHGLSARRARRTKSSWPEGPPIRSWGPEGPLTSSMRYNLISLLGLQACRFSSPASPPSPSLSLPPSPSLCLAPEFLRSSPQPRPQLNLLPQLLDLLGLRSGVKNWKWKREKWIKLMSVTSPSTSSEGGALACLDNIPIRMKADKIDTNFIGGFHCFFY